MRLKILLGTCALLLAAGCAADVTAPSTSRTAQLRADGGTNTVGSGGYSDSTSTSPR